MEAYEKLEALQDALRHVRLAEEALDGSPYAVIMHELTDVANDLIEEMLDVDKECLEANRQQKEEQERDYYAAVV